MKRLRYLFVTGSPYESVFEMGMLLNEHPQVLLGIQRYARVATSVDRFLLLPERAVSPLSVETPIRGELLYSRLRRRIEDGQLAITGDVDPGYVEILPMIAARLGAPSVIVVLGAAGPDELERWHTAAALARETERGAFAGRVFVLPYGAFTAGEGPWLDALLAFLELPATDRLDDGYARVRAAAASAHPAPDPDPGDPEALAWLEERAQRALERVGANGSGIVRLPDPVLSADELTARARERQQLLTQRRAGSAWPDERVALTQRCRQQGREIVVRGARITQLGLTAATDLPSPDLRVGLISPETAEDQIGRQHTMMRLASHLARLCTVRMFATEPLHAPPFGVDVQVVGSLTGELWDDCDVVVYPGDMPGGALLEGGRAIMLLDGFERPRGADVLANLERAGDVLATSSWLCTMARDHGASAILFPMGLDRTTFSPGPPQEERRLHVTGVAQTAEHLGCFDLSEAMVRVRERRPEVEVTLFGGVPADGATAFLRHPPVAVVAETLRSSAIHVTGARDEGFGFVGAAALACGSALVTTDNPGSRDYAAHGRTALVSPAGDPQALADHVLMLLDDPGRRAQLALAGARQVRAMLPPWAECARALAVLLTQLR